MAVISILSLCPLRGRPQTAVAIQYRWIISGLLRSLARARNDDGALFSK